MEAEPREQRIKKLEADNRRLRGENQQVKTENDKLRQLIKQLQ